MYVLEVKSYIEVDKTFNKASLEHINYKLSETKSYDIQSNDSELNNLLVTKSFTLDEIDKACDCKKEISKVPGVKKVHYALPLKIPIKRTYKRINHPLMIILYSTIGVGIALFLATEAGRTENLLNIWIAIIMSAIAYFIAQILINYKRQHGYDF
ncbi:MAG: hypothetical protein ACRD47_05260 [Nitrososphaeraceae archaeon]